MHGTCTVSEIIVRFPLYRMVTTAESNITSRESDVILILRHFQRQCVYTPDTETFTKVDALLKELDPLQM